MVMLGTKYYSGKKAKDGDVITFVDEGAWVDTKFKKDDGSIRRAFQMTIEVNNEQCVFNLNKKNSDVLVEAWGHETKEWIGRKAKVTLKEAEIAGEDMIVIRLKPCDVSPDELEEINEQ